MQKTDSKTLIHGAGQLLVLADEERNRAAEDTVNHMICHNSRQSIVNYLLGFLIVRGVHPVWPTTMARLLAQCQEVDESFKELDFSSIHCRFESHDRDYCLDKETVDECFKVAKQTEAIVNRQLELV